MPFKVVSETETEDPAPTTQAAPAGESSEVTRALALLLKGLSQKALVAISNCFTVLTLGAALYLWMEVMTEPTTQQLVGLGMFGVFSLALEVIRRR